MAKKKKIVEVEFEFPIRCSARLLFQMISTPTGLSDWFAEKVENIGDTFIFHWGDDTETAEMTDAEDCEFVRYDWVDGDHPGEFFEFNIKVDELTNDVALVVTDFCEEGDEKSLKLLWETQVNELMHSIGAA